MFERVYTNPVAKGEEAKAKDIMRKLFDYYYTHPGQAAGGLHSAAGF